MLPLYCVWTLVVTLLCSFTSHIWEIVLCLTLSFWLTLHRMISSSSIYVAAKCMILFFLKFRIISLIMYTTIPFEGFSYLSLLRDFLWLFTQRSLLIGLEGLSKVPRNWTWAYCMQWKHPIHWIITQAQPLLLDSFIYIWTPGLLLCLSYFIKWGNEHRLCAYLLELMFLCLGDRCQEVIPRGHMAALSHFCMDLYIALYKGWMSFPPIE